MNSYAFYKIAIMFLQVPQMTFSNTAVSSLQYVYMDKEIKYFYITGSFSWEIYLKRNKHLLRETRMQNKVKSYLESLKYQKGIRVLHDFHVRSITSMYEVSVKFIGTISIKKNHFYRSKF